MTGDLVTGLRSALSIRFVNTGTGPCTDMVFTVGLPPGIVLLGGTDRVVLPVLAAGRTHVHELTLQARTPGPFDLVCTNFSYRDENHEPVRVTGWRAGLSVRAAPVVAPVPQPTGRLGVICETPNLVLGAWDELRILVINDAGIPLEDVMMAVTGPFSGAVPRSRISVLGPGMMARFTFQVNVAEAGRHVPLTARTTYTSGGAVTRTQVDHLTVAAQPPVPPSPPPSSVPQSILYLAANPRDLPPLRSDEEMRRVKERLQLARNRDRYRIEPALAVRFDDISQSLVDHQPAVVHFSGHGDRDGNLGIEDNDGRCTKVTPEGLAALFSLHSRTLRCVILNACYSERLAWQLAPHVGHVVGMRSAIGDPAAIEFSVGFYLGLFDGHPVPDAFARGRAHLLSRPGLAPEHQTPVLFPPGPSW
ncbi:CHAT domain-containing protein [Actinoplanes sp. NPDC051851]|uniref:CHAT domain-containing protein n=1 Tax=Actinoplanes sp. NPDC051851 TaxID=3154753 RepID=UPI003429045C